MDKKILKPLGDYTVPELKDELDDANISYTSKDVKSDLYQKLEKHYNVVDIPSSETRAEDREPVREVSVDQPSIEGRIENLNENDEEDLGQEGEEQADPKSVNSEQPVVQPEGLNAPNASHEAEDVINPKNVPNTKQPDVYENNTVEVEEDKDKEVEVVNGRGVVKKVFSGKTHGLNFKKLADEYAQKTGYSLRQYRNAVDPTLTEYRLKQAILDRLAGLTREEKLDEIERMEVEWVKQIGPENLTELKKSA